MLPGGKPVPQGDAKGAYHSGGAQCVWQHTVGRPVPGKGGSSRWTRKQPAELAVMPRDPCLAEEAVMLGSDQEVCLDGLRMSHVRCPWGSTEINGGIL